MKPPYIVNGRHRQRLWDADELVPYTVVEVATPAAAAWSVRRHQRRQETATREIGVPDEEKPRHILNSRAETLLRRRQFRHRGRRHPPQDVARAVPFLRGRRTSALGTRVLAAGYRGQEIPPEGLDHRQQGGRRSVRPLPRRPGRCRCRSAAANADQDEQLHAHAQQINQLKGRLTLLTDENARLRSLYQSLQEMNATFQAKDKEFTRANAGLFELLREVHEALLNGGSTTPCARSRPPSPNGRGRSGCRRRRASLPPAPGQKGPDPEFEQWLAELEQERAKGEVK